MTDPKIAEKILEADIKNLMRKVAKGKPLTQSERRTLAAATIKADSSKATFARNKVELAKILGVDRTTIYLWYKLPDHPTPAANGTHNIEQWVTFIRQQGLKDTASEGAQDLKDRRLRIQCQKLEEDLKIMRGEYIPAAEIKSFLNSVFSTVRARILSSKMPEEEIDSLLIELRQLSIYES